MLKLCIQAHSWMPKELVAVVSSLGLVVMDIRTGKIASMKAEELKFNCNQLQPTCDKEGL